MQTLDYRGRGAVTVDIEGHEYALAERTEKTEKALRNLESRVRLESQYASDLALIRILIGEEAVAELFPREEDENLDRLHYYAVKLGELYQAEYQRIEEDRHTAALKQVDALANRAASVLSLAEMAQEKRKRGG